MMSSQNIPLVIISICSGIRVSFFDKYLPRDSLCTQLGIANIIIVEVTMTKKKF